MATLPLGKVRKLTDGLATDVLTTDGVGPTTTTTPPLESVVVVLISAGLLLTDCAGTATVSVGGAVVLPLRATSVVLGFGGTMTVIVGPFGNVLALVGLLPSDLLLLEDDVRVTTLPLGNVVLLAI